MTMNAKAGTGKKGEDEACLYLMREGHTIIARNWRGGHGEMDIVSLDGKGLHFVEVKTRRAPVAADPEVNVDAAKRRHLIKTAHLFLRSPEGRPLADCETFFDVLTVVFEDETTYIQYYPQAFIPIYD